MNKETIWKAKLDLKVINFKDEDFDLRSEPFWVQDTYGWCDDSFDSIVYCSSIFVPKKLETKVLVVEHYKII